jgi:nickel transport protein
VSGDVRIIAPAGEEPFQTGKTDRNGVFTFAPDASGTWWLEVDDGMGHQARHEVDIDSSPLEGATSIHKPPAGEEAEAPAENGPPWTQAILGVVLILGVAAVVYLLKVTRA